MLKSFIALFAETFLRNKKSWIQAINTPHWYGDVKIDVQSLPDYEPNNYFKRYVPPSNGFIVYASAGESERFCLQTQGFFLCMLADITLWLFEFIKEKQYFYRRKILKNFVDLYRLERMNNVMLGGAL